MKNSFYSGEELAALGIKKYGNDVLISRSAVLYHPEQLEIGNHVRIDDFTVISRKVIVGNYVHISQFCSLYGGTEGIYMGDFATLASKCAAYAVSDDYSGNSMNNPTVPEIYTSDINAAVNIGRHVIIGCMSVILPGVTIGEGSAVGAMSLCNKSLGEFGIYAGIPVKRIKERKKKFLDLEKDFLQGGIIFNQK